MKKKLAMERQCAKCPWKVSTDPNSIPGGYSRAKHRALKETIAEHCPGTQRMMACHESMLGHETHCIGWLMHELGPGNNIHLRLRMLEFDLSKVELDGEQHSKFENTLP